MRFALIGRNVGLSPSPFVHETLFKTAGVTATYDAVETDRLDLSVFRALNELYDGYNVTAPFKRDAFYLTKPDISAEICRAVNTVYGENGSNTDGYGFIMSIDDINSFKTAAVLGCGGAAATVCDALLKNSIAVTVISRQANDIEGVGHMRFPPQGTFDLIVNATTVGNPYHDEKLCDDSFYASAKLVYDMNYRQQSILQTQCDRVGVKYTDGIAMLVYQAVKSQHVWGIDSYIPAGLIEKTRAIIKSGVKNTVTHISI